MIFSTLRFGRGVTQEIGHDLRTLKARKILVVTDPVVANTVAFEQVHQSLKRHEIPFTVFDDVKVEPSDASRSQIPERPMLPLIAVPTTAGTGSETTGAAIMDFPEHGCKSGIRLRCIKPLLALVDPLNVVSMPKYVAVYSGFDVLCHALESYTALPYNERVPRPRSPAERPLYQGSNPIISKYFRRSVFDPSDEEARTQMMLAASFAGIGFGNAGVHIAHGLSYPISSQGKRYTDPDYPKNSPLIPHGLSVVTTAAADFEFTAHACPDRHREAAIALGAEIPISAKPETIGKILADEIRGFARDFKTPNGLTALGFDVSDCERLTEAAIHSVPNIAAHAVTVYLFVFNPEREEDRLVLDFHKRATTEELIDRVLHMRHDLVEQTADEMELVEVMGTPDGHTFKERKLDAGEYPVAVQSLWGGRALSDAQAPKHRFVLRHKGVRSVSRFGSAEAASAIDAFLAKFLTQPQDREYADLCNLPELTEQTLLDNLRDRFNSGHIYTYIGPILVAVNPFSFFPIYNPKYARLYCSSALGSLPPHIFAIADVTYHNMLRIKENQCVVISGESGSGKTESTNFLLHHLTTLSQKGSTGCSVEQTLLSAGPVLEAFGNAVTAQNNNSSRFGKFIKVNYRENGMVSGANVEIYLLEKSRIISQAVGERNYHVFYYLLEGATEEERKEFFLMKPDDYNYLNQAMLAVGFPPTTQHTLQAIISAVLLLGNIKYIKRQGYHSDEAAYIENEEVVGLVAKLLNIRADHLSQALTMKRTITKNDTVISRYSVSEATNTRDAMAKCLYNALFHWIVLRINQQLLRAQSPTNGYYIGILDIFGFEDVGGQKNSYEQLCINYANEHLQAYFNQHIFQFEQEEYLKEGISWTNIEYTDNTECLHLFQAKPYGILRLIDEESNIHNGTDQSMLDKLNQFLKNNEFYEMPQKREKAFIVAHYAGKVKYQITGFREKNKDLMRHDVLVTLKNSKYGVVRELVGSDPVAVYRWTLVRSVFRALQAFKQAARTIQRSESAGHLGVQDEGVARGRRSSDSQLSAFLRGELRLSIPDFCDTSVFGTITSQARRSMLRPQKERLSTLKSLQILRDAMGRKRGVTSQKPTSVSRQFEYSLIRLMSTLSSATPYFIRCIKSNNEKIANHFDEDIILRQLRYTGMLETVRIRRAGYSVRIEYEAFINQYRILLPGGLDSRVEDVQTFIRNHPQIQEENVQYGLTKVFMRDAEKLILDEFLHRTIMHHIVTLQRWFRTVLARKKYLRLRAGVVRIQAMFRGMQLRNKLRQQSYAAMVIQTNWRRYRDEMRYKQLRATIIALQAAYRGAETRKRIGDIPRKGFNRFHITKIHTFQLPKFDLTNPASLAEFATSSDECSSEDESDDGLDLTPSEGDVFGTFPDDNVDLDVEFTFEDTKLKLIEEGPENAFHRRQSLAATASTSKLKMLRRAASTESDQIARKGETLRTLDEVGFKGF
ncbi:unnamed protein product, partial [Mesorhabditis spiculigera]